MPEPEEGRGPALRRREPVTSETIANVAQRILSAADLGQPITLSVHELRSLKALLRRLR